MELFAFSKMEQYTEQRCRLIFFITLTLLFFFIEITVGYRTNSLILIADAFHMLANIAAMVVSLLALKFTMRKCTKNTFGWARAEVLGRLVNAVFLVALCFSVTIEAIKRCIQEMPIVQPKLVATVGLLGLIVNFIGFCLLYEHHSHNRLKQSNRVVSFSQTAFYLFGDSLGSVMVIASAFITWKLNRPFISLVDPLLTICLVIMLLYSVLPLLHESALILLQTVPTHIKIEAIKKRLLENVADVLDIHEFHVWRLAGDRIIASAHIRCRNLSDYMIVAEKVKAFFHNEGIHSTTIQPEFFDMADCRANSSDFCALDCPVTEEGCCKSTCCQVNNKSNILTDNLTEVHSSGSAYPAIDSLAAEENIELVALK